MATESPIVAPYVTWGVFKSTIDTLAESTVPTGPLDRRVLHGLSGADHGALMSSLRYLGLVDGNRKATAQYRELVGAAKDSAKFSELMLNILDDAYKSVIGKLDLEHGTISELEKSFKEDGVSQGQMLTKTIRFFVKAYTDGGGFSLSPHITKPIPKASRANKSTAERTRARTTKAEPKLGQTVQESPPFPPKDAIPQGFERMPIPGMANAFIQYPTGLTASQCVLLEGAITFLKIYASKDSSGIKEDKP